MIRSLFILLFFVPQLWGQSAFKFDEYKAEDNFKRGVFYYNETKYVTATEFFIKALQYNPQFNEAKIWLGKSYFKSGYFTSSIETWQEVIDNGGADNYLIDKLNSIYYRMGKVEKRTLIKPYVHLKTIKGDVWRNGRFTQPISLFQDENNDLYITGLGSHSILRLDPNFNLIKSYSGKSPTFKMPYGLVIDQSGNIVASDVKTDTIQKFTKQGDHIFTKGGRGTTNGKFLGPEALCIDRYNNIIVIDTGNSRVQKLSPQGDFMMSFGEKGDENGQFMKPSGITLDNENNIYVADAWNKNIQKFDEDGNFIETVFGDKKFVTLRNIRYQKDFFFIADGSQGAYIYNYEDDTWLNIKYFNFAKDKLAFASDMYLGKDQTLFISDFYKSTVEVFVPEIFKYANLNLDVELMDTSQYPKVVLYTSVYKKDGTPVLGLSKNNFEIRELGVKMFPIDLIEKIYDKNSIKTIYLVEKSLSMKNYENELKEAGSFFVENILKTKDEVRVDLFHQTKWTGLKFDFSKLRVLASMEEDNYNTLSDVSKPLYESINELMNKLSRKALIFFTTGEYDIEKNFKTYEIETIKNYAKANHVTLYIINFTRNNEEKLKELAQDTGGEYYYYFKDLKRLKYIRDTIIKIPVNQYILVYETAKNRRLIDTWREVSVNVFYNKLVGKDKIGYFVPR